MQRLVFFGYFCVLLEISSFLADLDPKSAGNMFLRTTRNFLFPAEFSAENDYEAVANVPANNPQVIPH
jgi:hypothetical protein